MREPVGGCSLDGRVAGCTESQGQCQCRCQCRCQCQSQSPRPRLASCSWELLAARCSRPRVCVWRPRESERKGGQAGQLERTSLVWCSLCDPGSGALMSDDDEMIEIHLIIMLGGLVCPFSSPRAVSRQQPSATVARRRWGYGTVALPTPLTAASLSTHRGASPCAVQCREEVAAARGVGSRHRDREDRGALPRPAAAAPSTHRTRRTQHPAPFVPMQVGGSETTSQHPLSPKTAESGGATPFAGPSRRLKLAILCASSSLTLTLILTLAQP